LVFKAPYVKNNQKKFSIFFQYFKTDHICEEKWFSSFVQVLDVGGESDENVEVGGGAGAEVEKVGHLHSRKVHVILVDSNAGSEGHHLALFVEDGCDFAENGALRN
jgi:hypothetical protein